MQNTTLFNCKVNGMALTRSEMATISEYYDACCTAEYLLTHYENEITDEDTALTLAYEVREQMQKYDMSELDAIETVLSERKTQND